MRELIKKTPMSAAVYQSRLYGRSVIQKPLYVKCIRTACSKFTKLHLKRWRQYKKTIPCSNKTKKGEINPGYISKKCIQRRPSNNHKDYNTLSTVKHLSGSIGYVRVERNYTEYQWRNLLKTVCRLLPVILTIGKIHNKNLLVLYISYINIFVFSV